MSDTRLIELPNKFTFTHYGEYDFNRVLSVFDWEPKQTDVYIDFRTCRQANYQALSLLVLYMWHLRVNKCHVEPKYDTWHSDSASAMWRMMGATGLFDVIGTTQNFQGNYLNPLLAIRNNDDSRVALEKLESYTKDFDIEYEKTLRYVIAELLYNTLEHGGNKSIPSLIQFSWCRDKNELSFIVADLGVGIKQHLRQAYPQIGTDVEAIKYALRPQVSGTFSNGHNYGMKNNAGVGLFISSNIIRRLHADMRIVSGTGVVHISPTDITERTIESHWPGTFVHVTIRLGLEKDLSLHRMMAELREDAAAEIARKSEQVQQDKFYLHIRNYFSRYAEDKTLAIKVRDEKLLPAIAEGKSVTLDFDEVISAPHSFLNALLATPIRSLGLAAYKKMKIINAAPDIRETIDFILDENTS